MLHYIINSLFNRNRNDVGKEIDYETVKNLLKNDKNCILLDVRNPQEFKEYHLQNSINIPVYNLLRKIDNSFIKKENNIIIYCQTGSRSRKATRRVYQQRRGRCHSRFNRLAKGF